MKKEFKFGTDLDGKAKEELIRLAYEGKERSYAPLPFWQKTERFIWDVISKMRHTVLQTVQKELHFFRQCQRA